MSMLSSLRHLSDFGGEVRWLRQAIPFRIVAGESRFPTRRFLSTYFISFVQHSISVQILMERPAK